MKDAQEIKELFEKEASRYDLTNALLSFGIDSYWRKAVARSIRVRKGGWVADIATGTTKVATQIAQYNPNAKIIGLDFSPNMLRYGLKRLEKNRLKNVFFSIGDGTALPFARHSFDALTIVFGIRNIIQKESALKEFYEVLQPNGQLIIVEFGFPQMLLFRPLYRFYFNHILPRVGNLLVSSNDVYTYFRDSVHRFPSPETFIEMIHAAGFVKATMRPLTGGIVNVFEATKL